MDRLLHNAHAVVMDGDNYPEPAAGQEGAPREQRERLSGGWVTTP